MALTKSAIRSNWVGISIILCLISITVQGAQLQLVNNDTSSLIDAIYKANNEEKYPGKDTIIMPTNVTFILAELNDDNQNGLPPITSEIQIIGNGSSINRSITAPPFRFFLIEPEGHLMLENLTVNGGLANLGGAFYNKGVIEINGGGVIDNHALYRGGAIFNYVDSVAIINGVVFDSNSSEQHAGGAIYSWSGHVSLTNVSLINNIAPSAGGGAVYATRYATTVIERSTLANNRARHGGAVYNFFAANMMINNSTFSNNRSDDFGGAIADIKGAFLSLTQSTLVDNRDNTLGSTIYLENNAEHIATGSIIASSEDVATLCSGNMLHANSSNFATDNSCGESTFTTYSDLMLGPLNVHGGMTATYNLYPGSRAIDHIQVSKGIDQRGIPRPLDGNADAIGLGDAGAFEHETMIFIDINPKSTSEDIKLNVDHLDVLVTGGIDFSQFSDQDIISAIITFGPNQAVPAKDLSKKNYLKNHLTDSGLMLHFNIDDTGLKETDSCGCLVMHFANGQYFRGCEFVNFTP